jgi:hypothetical protein
MILPAHLQLMRHQLSATLWRLGAGARSQPPAKLKFTPKAKRRLLLVSLTQSIPQSQIYPFHFYANSLREKWGIETLEISLDTWEKQPELAPDDADIVAFQVWIDKLPEQTTQIAQRLRDAYPSAKLAFLDPFAPTDLRYAAAIGNLVDVYVKKHLLRDRSQYGQATLGDTNLTDWFGRIYSENLPTRCFSIPDGFLKKIIVGPTFFTAHYLLPSLAALPSIETHRHRPIDVHARLGGAGDTGWYEKMRTASLTAVEKLPSHLQVTPVSRVAHRTYMREMRNSRVCFSPFGYGEACFRDYEAVISGTLLIKPDMAHIETTPDIFIPHKTYVPIAWDYADLTEKVVFYTKNEAARQRIVTAAYAVLHRYAHEAAFVTQMAPLLAP